MCIHSEHVHANDFPPSLIIRWILVCMYIGQSLPCVIPIIKLINLIQNTIITHQVFGVHISLQQLKHSPPHTREVDQRATSKNQEHRENTAATS